MPAALYFRAHTAINKIARIFRAYLLVNKVWRIYGSWAADCSSHREVEMPPKPARGLYELFRAVQALSKPASAFRKYQRKLKTDAGL
jgi:hypothetical protein